VMGIWRETVALCRGWSAPDSHFRVPFLLV
jgi:hypothetical protein